MSGDYISTLEIEINSNRENYEFKLPSRKLKSEVWQLFRNFCALNPQKIFFSGYVISKKFLEFYQYSQKNGTTRLKGIWLPVLKTFYETDQNSDFYEDIYPD